LLSSVCLVYAVNDSSPLSAHETIDGLAVKSGFPPIGLQPVDFSAIYNQALNEGMAKNG